MTIIIETKGSVKRKTDKETEDLYISELEVTTKFKLKGKLQEMYDFCQNNKKTSDAITRALEIKTKQLLQQFSSLSYNYSGMDFAKAINNIEFETKE